MAEVAGSPIGGDADRGTPSAEHMVVVVRVRGLTERERQLCTLRYPHRVHVGYRCLECLGNGVEVIASDPDSPAASQAGRRYAFDRIFDENATTEDVYAATVEPLLPGLLEGYNATCFAYGMTGAGKTFTMMGTERSRGLCFMAVEDLFPRIETAAAGGTAVVYASYLEIYNEKVKDLLTKDDDKRHDIAEDPARGVVVTDLTEYSVANLQDLHTLIALGCQRRTKASTASNVVSSRSHAILLITVKRQTHGGDADDVVTYGKLSLIDLAGSERAVPGESQRGVRLQEGANINRSLLALGNCITILGSKGGSKKHVPYRDSKLTRLLKDSLGGNTRTTMIGNVSPSSTCYEEVVSTLKYATRARNISRHVTRNAVVADAAWKTGRPHPVIDALKTDIAQLRTRLVIKAAEKDSVSLTRPSRNGGSWFRPTPIVPSPARTDGPTHHPNTTAPAPSAIPEAITTLRSALVHCQALEEAYAKVADEALGLPAQPPAPAEGARVPHGGMNPVTFASAAPQSPLRRTASTPPPASPTSPRGWRPPGSPPGPFPAIAEPPRNQERERRRQDERRKEFGLTEWESPGRLTRAHTVYFHDSYDPVSPSRSAQRWRTQGRTDPVGTAWRSRGDPEAETDPASRPVSPPRQARTLQSGVDDASRVRPIGDPQSELSTDEWGAIHALLQDLPAKAKATRSKWRDGTCTDVLKRKPRVWRNTPH